MTHLALRVLPYDIEEAVGRNGVRHYQLDVVETLFLDPTETYDDVEGCPDWDTIWSGEERPS